MAEKMKPQLSGTEEKDAHEERDWKIAPILIVLSIVFGLIITALISSRLVMFIATRRGGGMREFYRIHQVPPYPRLQRVPREDWQKLKNKETTLLNSYGWINQQKGIVHIPIDQAINQVLQEGFPVRPQKGGRP